MESTTEKGNFGEALALKHLRSKGYDILETKWRAGRNEIDIIARSFDSICFVEVKLRENNWAGAPFTFVKKQKQRSIIRAADRYVRSTELGDLSIRFDIISIVHNAKYTEIEHLEDAFYPTL